MGMYDNADGRIRGRALQARRLRVWAKNPHCANCGDLTDITAGSDRPFELDHVVALVNGGEDTDENCQVLCLRRGCHEAKTRGDLGRRPWAAIGADGWPIDQIPPGEVKV